MFTLFFFFSFSWQCLSLSIEDELSFFHRLLIKFVIYIFREMLLKSSLSTARFNFDIASRTILRYIDGSQTRLFVTFHYISGCPEVSYTEGNAFSLKFLAK